MSERDDSLKKAAAASAVALVTDGMIVGLGSGSTAAFAVSDLGERVKQGLRIVGVPTSEQTTAHARKLGIPLASLEDEPSVDITIDGADQVEEGTLNLVKGHGGALLREKIVASASKRLVIIVHREKVVPQLVMSDAVPMEVVPFGWQVTAQNLARLGAKPQLRRNGNGEPYRSDGGHFILDCTFAPGSGAVELAGKLDHVVGLVEHGFFIALTAEAHVAGTGGVQILKPKK